MSREQQALDRAAEKFVAKVVKNYVYRKQMSEGYTSLKTILEPAAVDCIEFDSLSAMRTWLIDIENIAKVINLRCGLCLHPHEATNYEPSCPAECLCSGRRVFDFWGLVGDRLFCGLSFEKAAGVRRLSVEGIRSRYWVAVRAIFYELVSRDMSEEYVMLPPAEDAKAHKCAMPKLGKRCPIYNAA